MTDSVCNGIEAGGEGCAWDHKDPVYANTTPVPLSSNSIKEL